MYLKDINSIGKILLTTLKKGYVIKNLTILEQFEHAILTIGRSLGDLILNHQSF